MRYATFFVCRIQRLVKNSLSVLPRRHGLAPFNRADEVATCALVATECQAPLSPGTYRAIFLGASRTTDRRLIGANVAAED